MAGPESTAAAPDLFFRTPVDVRFRDLDALGHVNNAVFATYLEIARTRYWEALGERRYDFVLARLEIDYRAPVDWGDALEAWIGVTGFGRSSFEFTYRLVHSGTGVVVAGGRSVQVWYDHGARRALPVPDEIRARVAAFEARLRGEVVA
jgi:acyl-CoA thioester hydrolase